MYAVFEDGSRQYRVSEGDRVKVDYRDTEPGKHLEFKRVLLYKGADETRIGEPTIDGMRIVADVVGETSTKLYIQHFRRRKNYRRLKGHRQFYTEIQVRNILLPGMEPTPPPKSEAAPPSQPTA